VSTDLLEKPPELTPAEVAAGGVLRRVPELLSPAGDWEALKAAVANGADAVFFGLDNFNARHRAENFKRAELPEIIRYLHDHNVQGFLTFNTLLFSDELAEAQAYLRDVAAAGVDAVIVQDLGLCRLLKAVAPTLPIHASTQMTLTEPRGVEFVRDLGVTRAVLARELSVDEIRKIAISLAERQRTLGTPMPDLEVFCHGALCVSYSGQCLTSESLGGRSANRGQCAQACRLPYQLVVDGQPTDLGEKAYLLSPQDLAAYDLVDELADAGVACLKIEGRLKAAHYVAATTQTYRAAIDAASANRDFTLTPDQKGDLEQTFSRGLSHGFLAGVNHQVLVHARFPKSRGRRLGTVVSTSARSFVLQLDSPFRGEPPLKAGDGIVFDEGHPDQDEQGGRVFAVKASGSGRLEVELRRGDVSLHVIARGALVWKTDDPALRRRLEHSYSREKVAHRRPLKAIITARVGGFLSLTLSDEHSTASAQWSDRPLEAAQRHPADEANLREQLSRLGETPYELGQLVCDLAGGPMIPKSVLNDLRRQCVASLLDARESRRPHAVAEPDALDRLRSEAARVAAPSETDAVKLHVLVRELAQLEALLRWRAASPDGARIAGVYCDFEDVRRYRDAIPSARAEALPIALATVRVVKPREEGLLRYVLDSGPDAVLVRNLAAVAVARAFAPDMPLLGDYSLNVSNELTAHVYANAGLRRLVPSYDLSWRQMKAMFQRFAPGYFECVVHQHMPMFHMEHCVFSHLLSDGTDYRTCGRPCESHRVELKDREGQPHPLLADVGCRNTLFNAAAQSALEYIPEMLSLGIRHFRLELLREHAGELPALLDRYIPVLAGRVDPKSTLRSLRVLSQLGVLPSSGVTRGTLDRE
jgi:U32 family peptidase